jgi:hypothetical protein
MEYAEVPTPAGDGRCSDDACPCGLIGVKIPRGQGYLWITKEFVEFRRDCLTFAEAEAKIERLASKMDSLLMLGAGTAVPILVCEQGANRRRLDMKVASEDAKHWWETGMVPLRATPEQGQIILGTT